MLALIQFINLWIASYSRIENELRMFGLGYLTNEERISEAESLSDFFIHIEIHLIKII